MPRITALHMLRSTIRTVSAPASSSFRGSLPHPTQPLCTLRVRRRRRLTQHSLPGGLLGLTWAGLAPADRASFAGAFLRYDALKVQHTGVMEDIRACRLYVLIQPQARRCSNEAAGELPYPPRAGRTCGGTQPLFLLPAVRYVSASLDTGVFEHQLLCLPELVDTPIDK